MLDTEIVQALGRVEGKVDLLVAGMTKHFDDDNHNFEKVHKKIDGLRNKWAFAAGGAAVITFFVSNYGLLSSVLGMLPH